MLTLVPAAYVGFRRGGDFRTVAFVLIASFCATIPGWTVVNPILTNAMADTLCAGLIAVFCAHQFAIRIGFLFAASALVSIIYGVAVYPETEYNRAYAHILSALGHAQNLALFWGAADDGIRRWIGRQVRRLVPSMVRLGLHNRRSSSEVDGP